MHFLPLFATEAERQIDEKGQSQEGQGEVEWPAEEIDLQTRQELIQIDHARRRGMLSVKANALTEAPGIPGKKEIARRGQKIAGEQKIIAQVESTEDHTDYKQDQPRLPAFQMQTLAIALLPG